MIKKYYYPFICLVFLFLFINWGNLQVNAGIFDDEQDLEKVLKKLDKSELHLEQLINEIRQTNSILKNDLVDSIASSYEKYIKKDITYINKINSKLLDLEGYLKNEIAAEFARQRSDNQQLKSNLDGQFNQLTDELEKDLEKNNLIRASNLDGENLINLTIYEFDMQNDFIRTIHAKSANISSSKWILNGITISDKEGNFTKKKDGSNFFYKSTYDLEKIK